jgi:hypothetical protein
MDIIKGKQYRPDPEKLSINAYAKTFFASILCVAITFLPVVSHADGCFPFQLSLITPVQLVHTDRSICGVRLNLLYGSNREVWGLDAGAVNKAGNFSGIELGLLVNVIKSNEETTSKPSWGIQAAGLVNRDSRGSFTGIEVAGISNENRKLHFTGMQAAIVGNKNRNGDVTGMQVAMFNHSTTLNGIQAGLGNGVTPVEGIVDFVVLPIFLAAALLSGHGGTPPFYIEKDARMNTIVNGVQLGVFTNITEDLNGLQLSLFNYAGKTMNGSQLGVANMGAPDVQGLQLGLFNFASKMDGFQLSGINFATDVDGLQIGLVNACRNLKGVQIGAINIVGSRYPDKGVFISPLVNVGF